MSRHRSLRSLAIRGLIAGGVLFLASGSGTVTTLGCSADLRDLYACDALAHAKCGKWKDCGAINDEDACYKAELDVLGGTSTSARIKCLDKLPDARKCLTDIQDLSCDNKLSTLDSCGSATINAAVVDPNVAQVLAGKDAGPTGTGTDSGGLPRGTGGSSGTTAGCPPCDGSFTCEVTVKGQPTQNSAVTLMTAKDGSCVISSQSANVVFACGGALLSNGQTIGTWANCGSATTFGPPTPATPDAG